MRGPGGHQQALVVDQTGPKPSSYSQLFRPRAPVECRVLKVSQIPRLTTGYLGSSAGVRAKVLWYFEILRGADAEKAGIKVLPENIHGGGLDMKSGTCTYTI